MNLFVKSKFSLSDFTLFLLSISAWFGLRPYFIVNDYFFISLFVYVSFLLLVLTNKITANHNKIIFAVIYLFICFYFTLPGKESIHERISLGFLSIAIVAFLSNNNQIKLFEFFRTLYVITLIPAIFIFIIDILGFSLPYSAIHGFKEGMGLGYVAFLGNVKTAISDTFMFYRFEGMYDEPGVVGTISGLLLVLDKFRFNRKSNYILMFSGIISFSFAFYFLMAFYFLILWRWKLKSLMTVLIFISLLLYFPATRFYTIHRFSYNKTTNRFKFDNRESSSFRELYNSKITHGDLKHKLFGYGANAYSKYHYNVSRYNLLIYDKGYVGFVSLILFYIIYSTFYLKDWSNRIIILIFLSSIYQRPAVMTLFFSIIFLGGVAKLNKEEKEKCLTKVKTLIK